MAHLDEALGVSGVAARTLVCRGITRAHDARAFLGHDLAGLIDPARMKDMDRAVALVEDALGNSTCIRVYGDYDVDGVCATALLVRALRGLGGDVDWHIPHRVDEGYGLNEEAICQAKEDGIGLLVTVDCGSTAVAEVAHARELGLSVLVTDHHRPDEQLPDAPILNPWRRDCGYPFKDLAGVGVAFKLVSAIARARGLREGAELRFLDLVCLGTVGDVVPLLGENRVFVQHGLDQLAHSAKLGIGTLLRASRINPPVRARQVAFGLAPRINAAGRMEHAQAALNLLLTEDAEEANRLAAQLCEQNDRRRAEERQTTAQAEELLSREIDLTRDKVIVLASETWHPGVIGIVASRLVERYHRPVLLVAVSDGAGKGSGRSVAALNLWEALRECEHLLSRFGGHHYAAGFAIAAERVPELRQRINEIADSRLTMADLVREVPIDAEARIEDMSLELTSELDRLAPFGTGNPAPVLMTAGLKVSNIATVGGGSHLSLQVRGEGNTSFDAIWFNQGSLLDQLAPGATLDACYRPRRDEWNGAVRLRLFIEDLRLSASR